MAKKQQRQQQAPITTTTTTTTTTTPPTITYAGIIAGEPALPSGVDLAGYKTWQTGCREYYKRVLNELASRSECTWLTVVNEANEMRETSPGAAAVAAGSWISRLRAGFRATFPGRALEPVKAGPKIILYEAVVATDTTTAATIAAITAIWQRFPALFTSDLELATIKDTVVHEREHAAEAALVHAELMQLDDLAADVARSLATADATAATLRTYGVDATTTAWAAEYCRLTSRQSEIAASIRERRVA